MARSSKEIHRRRNVSDAAALEAAELETALKKVIAEGTMAASTRVQAEDSAASDNAALSFQDRKDIIHAISQADFQHMLLTEEGQKTPEAVKVGLAVACGLSSISLNGVDPNFLSGLDHVVGGPITIEKILIMLLIAAAFTAVMQQVYSSVSARDGTKLKELNEKLSKMQQQLSSYVVCSQDLPSSEELGQELMYARYYQNASDHIGEIRRRGVSGAALPAATPDTSHSAMLRKLNEQQPNSTGILTYRSIGSSEYEKVYDFEHTLDFKIETQIQQDFAEDVFGYKAFLTWHAEEMLGIRNNLIGKKQSASVSVDDADANLKYVIEEVLQKKCNIGADKAREAARFAQDNVKKDTPLYKNQLLVVAAEWIQFNAVEHLLTEEAARAKFRRDLQRWRDEIYKDLLSDSQLTMTNVGKVIDNKDDEQTLTRVKKISEVIGTYNGMFTNGMIGLLGIFGLPALLHIFFPVLPAFLNISLQGIFMPWTVAPLTVAGSWTFMLIAVLAASALSMLVTRKAIVEVSASIATFYLNHSKIEDSDSRAAYRRKNIYNQEMFLTVMLAGAMAILATVLVYRLMVTQLAILTMFPPIMISGLVAIMVGIFAVSVFKFYRSSENTDRGLYQIGVGVSAFMLFMTGLAGMLIYANISALAGYLILAGLVVGVPTFCAAAFLFGSYLMKRLKNLKAGDELRNKLESQEDKRTHRGGDKLIKRLIAALGIFVLLVALSTLVPASVAPWMQPQFFSYAVFALLGVVAIASIWHAYKQVKQQRMSVRAGAYSTLMTLVVIGASIYMSMGMDRAMIGLLGAQIGPYVGLVFAVFMLILNCALYYATSVPKMPIKTLDRSDKSFQEAALSSADSRQLVDDELRPNDSLPPPPEAAPQPSETAPQPSEAGLTVAPPSPSAAVSQPPPVSSPSSRSVQKEESPGAARDDAVHKK